ncbi:MAG: hypothetical protein WBP79_17270 [Candidatus Acidiferrales bacterium]
MFGRGPAPELDPNAVRPHGIGGVGLLTEHPVGLLVILAVVLQAVLRLPEAVVFLAGSVTLGAIFGLCLWLRHR